MFEPPLSEALAGSNAAPCVPVSKFHAPQPLEVPHENPAPAQQEPPRQVPLQVFPQPPQFDRLTFVFTHEPPQQLSPLHEWPHVPQFVALVVASTHVPLHPVCPVPQHVPLEQFPLVHCTLLVQLPLVNLDVQLALLQ
jgi:hypothetical protein